MIKDKPINTIVHSDHGRCYSSSEFIKMLKEFNWKQSISRVRNSLDNWVEFWFSILKTELIYNLNTKKISFKELENEIDNFIHYYNNVRIQEKLNWMTPT
ncbi:MAG: IS3 family transposase [Mycoplasmataceae bacterium]|nr:IS3 family transposase [Mycoplasmataceae bacterium]